MSDNTITKEEVFIYLENIIKISDDAKIVIEAKILFEKISNCNNDEHLSNLLNQFDKLKSKYLEEQRQWAQNQGFTTRRNSYSD